MNQTIASRTPSRAEPVGAERRSPRVAGSRMTVSRVIGALFLAGFLLYGVGTVLANSVTGGSNFLSTISAHKEILILGAFLILLNTFLDVGKAVLFFPILEKHGKRTALGYLATMILEVVFLNLGALALLMIVPLAQHAGEGWAKGVGSLLVQTNLMAYAIGEAILGFGAIFLAALLYRSRLIPGWLAVSGLIGYACLLAGQIAEIFGIHIGTYSVIPGFFFEVALPVWLFTKGFQPEAYAGVARRLNSA
jgi:Domain of unknown function (DUF4386)